MTNYQFCVQWVLGQNDARSARILDYGCGAGEIVMALRKRNINAYGCDAFYAGGDYSKSINEALLAGQIVKKMDGTTIPFDSASFDLIINNQVMEHVSDIHGVLAEFQRVLAPGGQVLSLFPDRSVWREGHCGIPFLHRFPRGGRFRIYYAAVLRVLGLGYHKKDKGVMRWSRDFCRWLDTWTHYRTYREIDEAYKAYFYDIRHIEVDWLRFRLGGRHMLVAWIPAPLRKFVVEKLAGMVFVARKTVA